MPLLGPQEHRNAQLGLTAQVVPLLPWVAKLGNTKISPVQLLVRRVFKENMAMTLA